MVAWRTSSEPQYPPYLSILISRSFLLFTLFCLPPLSYPPLPFVLYPLLTSIRPPPLPTLIRKHAQPHHNLPPSSISITPIPVSREATSTQAKAKPQLSSLVKRKMTCVWIHIDKPFGGGGGGVTSKHYYLVPVITKRQDELLLIRLPLT